MIRFPWQGIGLAACFWLLPLVAQSKPAQKPADRIVQSRAALTRAFIALQKALGGSRQSAPETL